MDEITCPEKIAATIEAQMPAYPPGTKTAYQALSYGHILDLVVTQFFFLLGLKLQLFKRIDPKKRYIGQFFRDEVADRHHIDLHIGDCAQEEGRIARLMKTNNILAAKWVSLFFKERKEVVGHSFPGA